MSKAQDWGSVPRLAWAGLVFVALLSLASGILLGLMIMGHVDWSRLWLPATLMVIMVVVGGFTGWRIGSAPQRQRDER